MSDEKPQIPVEAQTSNPTDGQQPNPEDNVPSVDVKPRPALGAYYFVQGILGFVAFIGVLVLMGFAIGLTGNPWASLFPLVISIALFAVVSRQLRWPGFVVGGLIGLGLLVLGLGLCFASN